jgi:hypothetical protein
MGGGRINAELETGRRRCVVAGRFIFSTHNFFVSVVQICLHGRLCLFISWNNFLGGSL